MDDIALALKDLVDFCGDDMALRIYNRSGKTVVMIYWGDEYGQFTRFESHGNTFDVRFANASSAAIEDAKKRGQVKDKP